jgi:carboxyl-terminal processing protease
MQIQKSRGKKLGLGPFGKGIALAFAFGFVFVAGMQIGSGNWSLSFSRQAITANKGLPNKLDYSSVDKVYDDLRRKFDGELDEQKLLDGLKKGLVEAAGDPYTVFMNEEEANAFADDLAGVFVGIGAILEKDGDYVIIETPLQGYPAERAGLKAKDIIIKIDGQDAVGLSTAEAVKRIRGEEGTSVNLVVVRGGSEQLEFTINREKIDIPSLEVSYEDNGNIGVIEISQFSSDTVSLMNKAIDEFKAKGVKGIIVDVRNNPGGYLDSAVGISGKWLKTGQTIVEERRDGKVVEEFTAKSVGPLSGIPTVILVNEGSASASEILAGALKDNGAAKLVGVTTYGKGSVQETVQYDKGGLLKVTVARWYTPNGQNISESGIEPDEKVELTEEDVANKKDPQKDKAIQLLQAQY